ncbi:MAG: hypothetical protein ABSA02_27135 [Trebonia sp.]
MEDPVLEAARQIRPFLTGLVGSAAAGPLDEQIAELLVAAQAGQGTAGRLRDLLRGDEATSAFLEEVLADAPEYRPSRWQRRAPTRGIYETLPGDLLPMHAGKYTCLTGRDYTWYRPDVGVPVPNCPTHHVVLVKVG